MALLLCSDSIQTSRCHLPVSGFMATPSASSYIVHGHHIPSFWDGKQHIEACNL